MKRLLLFAMALTTSGLVFAGGIVTNTNQSAMYTRMQARDATLGIDAVYFNPAGLTLLPNNGLYLSLNNQTLGQTRTITSNYTYLNEPREYLGDVSAPFFPGIYAAYKMDKFAFSLGFNPIGGGGGGVYEDGLPSFEYGISDLVPALNPTQTPTGAIGYRMDVNFEGTSAWMGYQANISYQINEMISVALGARFVQAKDSYEGYLRDIQLNMGGTWTDASLVMTGVANQFRPGLNATSAIVDGGGGSLTFEEAEGAGIITPTERAQLEGGLVAMGQDPSTLTIAEAKIYYQGAVSKYDGTAAVLQDQEALTEATATGITPIISVNFKLNDQLNFSLKYEHQTNLEFTYDTEKDFTTGFESDGTPITKFPDGTKYRKDMPAQLVVGATYKPIDKLLVSTGYHLYLDKNADWDGNEENLDGNSWEFALGLEYNFTEKLLASAGWLATVTGATEAYQSDLSFSLPSNTLGGGLAYKFTPKIELNLAGQYTNYAEGQKNFTHNFTNNPADPRPVTETYKKPIWIAAVGLNINFSAGK